MGPIPFTAIVEYTKLFKIPDFEEFSYVIRRLDHTFLELNAEKEKQSQAKAEKNNNGGNNSGGR